MTTTSMLRLGGVLAALATPLDAEGRLDDKGLQRLVQHVVAEGVSGLSPTGSTGEGSRLSRDLRVEVVARTRAITPAAIPVIAGAPLGNVADGLRELHALADAGADAALVSSQVSYPLSDDDVSRFYETLAEQTPLPLVLYNIPAYTGVRIAPDLVERLAPHPNVIGIKDSSRDLEYQHAVILAASGAQFSVLTGTDTLLLASLALGAHGMIAASVNLVPSLSVSIYRAFTSGDLETARRDQAKLARIVVACRRGPAPAGWKAALAIAGICEDHMAAPASPLSEALRADLARALVESGVVRGDQ